MMVELIHEHLESNAEKYDDVETYFVDFLRDIPEMTGAEGDDALETPKIYEEMPSFDFVKEKVVSLMRNFNELNRGLELDLVFFHDCLVHLIIISRIIRTPRGNALLVGVGGSGKQSLTRLASFIAGYKFHQITLTRSYNVNNFVDDLKYLYRTAGVEGKVGFSIFILLCVRLTTICLSRAFHLFSPTTTLRTKPSWNLSTTF